MVQYQGMNVPIYIIHSIVSTVSSAVYICRYSALCSAPH